MKPEVNRKNREIENNRRQVPG
ncbi:MAG: hypothetical protein JWN60_1284, partial [Acidobacteria bacterium]|nr:hypothetical protein [Acidobacteriota bacterium]